MFAIIQKTILIHPSSVERKDIIIKDNIDKFKKTCTREHGIIIDILKYDIFENTIYINNSHLGYSVNINITYLKPINNTIVTAKISEIFSTGILLHIVHNDIIYDNYKIFIKDYKGAEKIGENLKVKIVDSKYSQQSYKCVGKVL
jgi:DNA-directed RNA polymerase subunit E'/Rpb7